MVKGRCVVYNEAYEAGIVRPSVFACVPEIGSSVSPVNEDKKHIVLKVANIIHTARYTNNEEMETEPFIIIELEEVPSKKK